MSRAVHVINRCDVIILEEVQPSLQLWQGPVAMHVCCASELFGLREHVVLDLLKSLQEPCYCRNYAGFAATRYRSSRRFSRSLSSEPITARTTCTSDIAFGAHPQQRLVCQTELIRLHACCAR